MEQIESTNFEWKSGRRITNAVGSVGIDSRGRGAVKFRASLFLYADGFEE